MKLLNLAALLILLGLADPSSAQYSTAAATRQAKLQNLAAMLAQRDLRDRQQVRAMARRLGIEARRELPNGRILELQRISPGIGPIFYITNNIVAADSVSTDEVWPGGSAGLSSSSSQLSLSYSSTVPS